MHLFRLLQSKIEPNFRKLKQFGKNRTSSLGDGDSILNDIHHKNITRSYSNTATTDLLDPNF